MSPFVFDHEAKTIASTKDLLTDDEHLTIAKFVNEGYHFLGYVAPKKKRASKNKAYYLKRLTNPEDKKEFERLCSLGLGHWTEARKFAESKLS